MKTLQMPSSYAVIPQEELDVLSGGGPLGDALDLFFGNLHLDDFFFGGGVVSLSFTFVPLLLLNVVTNGFDFFAGAYDTFANIFHFSHEERDMVDFIAAQQQKRQQELKPSGIHTSV